MFFDTHAHLDFPDFAGELPAVIQRATDAGIERIVTIGTDLASSARAVELSERFPSVFAAVGWHPCHALEAPEDIRPQLRALAQQPKVVAIGETGLDFARLPDGAAGESLKQKQADLLRQQLEVAASEGLNCIIHQRAAFEEVLKSIEPFAGRVRTVFHCFVDDAVSMKRVLDLNGLVSFTGIVTFKNAQNIRETVTATPLDRLMLETDCPFLAPVPYRGKRCEPAYVRDIAATVAQVKVSTLEELSQVTCDTARRFFSRLV